MGVIALGTIIVFWVLEKGHVHVIREIFFLSVL